jgi:hypothetical protein
MLDKYTKQAPLNNVVERVGAVSLLISGTPLSNWQNVVDKLPAGHIWSEETFEHAMTAFTLKYCSDTARQEQKRLMRRHIGLPHDQLTTSLFSRLQQLNRYIPYLPGEGNKMEADDLREILYNALPAFAHTLIILANYKWFETEKTDSEVTTYFDRLLVIGSIARGKSKNPMLNRHIHIKGTKMPKCQRKPLIGTCENVFFVVGTATTNCSVELKRKPKMRRKEKTK